MALSRSLFVFFVAFFLFSRLWDLGGKPYHHDESIHAMESLKFAKSGSYKFDPMLHGPLLYYVEGAALKILPVNNFTGRLSMAAMAIGTAYFGYLLLAAFPLAALIWLGFFAFSPTLAFYNRYLAMDTPMMFLALGFLVSLLRWKNTNTTKYFYFAVTAFALMVCTKLNFLFYAASMVTFLCIPCVWRSLGESERLRSLRWHWLWGFLLFAFIFCLLYSTFFTNLGGILDALYRRMIPYWVEQNKLQRIKGPFDYYLPMMAIYELPMLMILALSALTAANATVTRSRITGVTLGAAILLLWICQPNWASLSGRMDKVFHFSESWHPSLAVLECVAWVLLVSLHIKRKEWWPAFLAHWGFSSLLAYSYAGEKVPWLGTHIVLPFSFYAAWFLATRFEHWPKKTAIKMGALLTLAVIWQGYISIRSVITHSADPRERLVYTHTSAELVNFVDRVDRFAKKTGVGKELQIQVNGDSAWPLYWYFRDYTRWFYPTLEPQKNPAIAVVDWKIGETSKVDQFPGYHKERVKLREWWVPDPRKGTIGEYLIYYFTRETYSPVGSQDIDVLIRPDLMAKWIE